MRKESSAVRGQDGERERIMRNRVGIIGGGAAGMFRQCCQTYILLESAGNCNRFFHQRRTV